MPRKLDQQNIGDLGEKEFEKLCVRAGLHVSRQEPDRTGKDRIVEFDFPSFGSADPPDLVPLPPTCLFQVKTTTTARPSVAIKATVLKRLVDGPLPTFVCVIRLDQKGDPQRMWLFHFIDGVLSSALETLAHRHAKRGDKALEGSVSLALRDAIEVPVNPDALRDYLEDQVGPDSSMYAARKIQQGGDAGYEPGKPISLKMTLRTKDVPSLVEAFLGRADIDVVGLSAHEKRFGIERQTVRTKSMFGPIQPSPEFPLKLRPNPISTGVTSIFVEDPNSEKRATIEGEIFRPGLPNLPSEYECVVVQTPLLTVEFTANGFKADLNVDALDIEQSLKCLRESLSFLNLLRSGEVVLGVRPPNSDSVKTMPVEGSGTNAGEKYLTFFGHLADAAMRLVRLGRIDDVKVCGEDLWLWRKQIFYADAIMRGSVTSIVFPVEIDRRNEGGVEAARLATELSLATYVPIGAASLAYAARFDIAQITENEIWDIEVVRAVPLWAEFLPDSNADDVFQEFCDRAYRISPKCLHAIVPPDWPGV